MTVNRISDRDKERVRAEALGLGFSACAFTDALTLPRGEILDAWLEAGRHGSMDYLARPGLARLRPAELLSGARSVIVVARTYPAPPPPDPDWRSKLTGRVAAYAAGRDYHGTMAGGLNALASAMHEFVPGRSRAQVDAGPLVEKELAKKAGLGWFGHNTNLLAKRSGSYFLLGCLLTEAEFEPDPEMGGAHCGQCRACIPACPTGALDSGPTIDARLCISYLTIEHRGPIERELRALMGNWVFGCDACQEICPWNEESPVSTDSLLNPYLPDMLLMSEDQCRSLYRPTSLWRAKRRGLSRNAAVALGNSANPAAVEPLARALAGHDEPLVRSHAAWALGRIGGAEAVHGLERALVSEAVDPVTEEIGRALSPGVIGRDCPARV